MLDVKALAAVLAALLGTASCTSNGAQTPVPTVAPATASTAIPTNTTGLHERYRFVSRQRSTGTFTIPSNPTKATRRLESIRRSIDWKPLSYVVVTIDNTKGTSTVNMSKLVIVDNLGRQIESLDNDELLERWLTKADPEEDVSPKVFRAIVDLSEEGPVLIRPGARGAAVAIFDRKITSIKRAFVYPHQDREMVEARRV